MRRNEFSVIYRSVLCQSRLMHSLVERAKREAAHRAVDDNFPEKARVVGIGLGSTVVYAAKRIAEHYDKASFVCVPTGYQLKQLILDNGLRLGSIEEFPNVDIAFDGADEVDPNLNLIKGGGACLFQEKLVAEAAKIFIVIADYRKKSDSTLGVVWTRGIPIEVIPLAHSSVAKSLINLGAERVSLRQGGEAKAGPVVTDNNNFILDAVFGPIFDPVALHRNVKRLVGVVETGLFTNMTTKCYFGDENGGIDIWTGKDGKVTQAVPRPSEDNGQSFE